MWGFFSAEQLAEIAIAAGYDPSTVAASMTSEQTESFDCQLCNQDVRGSVFVYVEAPVGLFLGRKYHCSRLNAHLLAHLDDPVDEISNFISRKPVSS